MIWAAWRQHRSEYLAVAAMLCAVAIFVGVTGVLVRGFEGGIGCLQRVVTTGSATCGSQDDFRRQFGWLEGMSSWFNLIPGLVGVFLGAPLVAREIERGTQRLAWSQSVTRTRWIVVNVASLTGVAIIAGTIFTLLMSWWREPFDIVGSRFDPNGFDASFSKTRTNRRAVFGPSSSSRP